MEDGWKVTKRGRDPQPFPAGTPPCCGERGSPLGCTWAGAASGRQFTLTSRLDPRPAPAPQRSPAIGPAGTRRGRETRSHAPRRPGLRGGPSVSRWSGQRRWPSLSFSSCPPAALLRPPFIRPPPALAKPRGARRVTASPGSLPGENSDRRSPRHGVRASLAEAWGSPESRPGSRRVRPAAGHPASEPSRSLQPRPTELRRRDSTERGRAGSDRTWACSPQRHMGKGVSLGTRDHVMRAAPWSSEFRDPVHPPRKVAALGVGGTSR